MAQHELLGVELAGLNASRSFRRAEDQQARILEHVDDSRGQGRLRAHDRQVDPAFLSKEQQAGDVGRFYGNVIGDLARAPVARRHQQRVEQGALADLPRDGVLSGAVAYEQDFHVAPTLC